MKRISVLIPYKADSSERRRNLDAVVAHYRRILLPESEILVLEEGERPTLKKGDFRYFFRRSEDGIFHQTQNRNLLAERATGQVLVHSDSDVLVRKEQLELACALLLAGWFDVVWPYDGNFLQIGERLTACLCEDVSLFEQAGAIGYNPSPVASFGGCWCLSADAFTRSGGENEHLVSWGFNDWEREHRYRVLGLRARRIPGPLFHLWHPTSLNSRNRDWDTYRKNEEEFERIKKLDSTEMHYEVSRWKEERCHGPQPWIEAVEQAAQVV